MSCLWCMHSVNVWIKVPNYKFQRRNGNCAVFRFSYQTCSKMSVLFIISVHVVFSCVHKLTALEFQVLVLVECSWDICSVFLESFLGTNQVVMPHLPTNKTRQRWIENFSWLKFDANGKVMETMLLASRTERNG